MKKNGQLDELDFKIISLLKENGRISNIDISKKIEVAPTVTLERTKKLEKAGVIERYGAKISAKAIGKTVTVFMSVAINAQHWSEELMNTLAKVEDVVEVYEVAAREEYYILKVQTEGIDTLKGVMRKVSELEGVIWTRSSLVFDC